MYMVTVDIGRPCHTQRQTDRQADRQAGRQAGRARARACNVDPREAGTAQGGWLVE